MSLANQKAGFLSNPVVLITFGRLITVFIAVISLRVMTTLLPPAEYGVWAIFLSFQTFATLFLINPVDQHVYINTHKWSDEGSLISHLGLYNRYISIVSIVVTFVTWIWINMGAKSLALDTTSQVGIALLLGFYVYAGTWNANLTFMLNMLGCRKQSVQWTIVTALLGTLTSAILTYAYPHAYSWLLGQTFALSVGAYGSWRSYSNKAIFVNDTQNKTISFSDFLSIKTIINFCIPLAAATGFMWMQTSGYRLIISDIWGVTELGLLAVGIGIAAQLTGIVENLATQLVYPYFVRLITGANAKSVNLALTDLMNVLGPVYAIWAGFNALTANSFLTILTDEKYHFAAKYLLIGVGIEFFRSSTNLWTNTARALLKTNQLILPYATGALIIIVGSFSALKLDLSLMQYTSVLLLGSFFTFSIMIFTMQSMSRINIDKTRFCISAVIMMLSFYFGALRLTSQASILKCCIIVLLTGLIFSILTFFMVWKSPSLKRLMQAKLQPEQ